MKLDKVTYFWIDQADNGWVFKVHGYRKPTEAELKQKPDTKSVYVSQTLLVKDDEELQAKMKECLEGQDKEFVS